MNPLFSGGCACGAFRYHSSVAPAMALNCHCRDCQRASGSAYAAIFMAPDERLSTTGELRFHTIQTPSGNLVSRGFCLQCGSPVLGRSSGHPGMTVIQAASLDDPSGFQPMADIFTASAQPWDHMNPALPKFDRSPELPHKEPQ